MASSKKGGDAIALVFGKGPAGKEAPAPEDEDETTPEETSEDVPADVATALDEAGIDADKQGALYRAMTLCCQHEMGGED